MAQLNITFDQREILQMLADDTGSAYRELLRGALNAVLQAESAEQLGAERYERTDERSDMRNGTRSRSLTTRIGTIELTVPRHRNAPFKTLVFENFGRSEGALVTTMAEMVVGGVSTAKVGRVMEELCGRSFSRSTVSEACRELDAQVRRFRERPLEAEYPFVMMDATFPKAREDRGVRAKALMIAVGLTSEGTDHRFRRVRRRGCRQLGRLRLGIEGAGPAWGPSRHLGRPARDTRPLLALFPRCSLAALPGAFHSQHLGCRAQETARGAAPRAGGDVQ